MPGLPEKDVSSIDVGPPSLAGVFPTHPAAGHRGPAYTPRAVSSRTIFTQRARRDTSPCTVSTSFK